MAQCPKCHKEIDHLNAMVTERTLYNYTAGEFERKESIEFDVDYWKCPECYEQLDLAPDEDTANEFLAGGEK